MAAFSCDIQKAELQYRSKEGNICHAQSRGGRSFEACNFYCNLYKKALMQAMIGRWGTFILSVDLSVSIVSSQSFYPM